MTVNFSFHPRFDRMKNNANNTGKTEKKKSENFRKVAETTLLATSVMFGLYYFAKSRNLKQAQNESKNVHPRDFVKPEAPTFSEKNVTQIGTTFSQPDITVTERPRWNAQVSGYMSGTQGNSAGRKQPLKAGQGQGVIPSSKIKEIITDIKLYMQRSGIDEKNKKINPEALDEILTRILGKDSVRERPFVPAECMSKGRVKEYTAPNGRIYVLESHLHVEDGYVTRLYLTHKDRDLRAYLHPDGSFRLNSYSMSVSHFGTTAKGKRWMENSPFLTGNKN